MDSDSDAGPDRSPVTPKLLADLQAGLLDDATAAQVRRQARTDPDAAHHLAGLDAVRRELAHLGSPDSGAADVPAAVTARIGAALRAAPAPLPPAHIARRPALSRAQSIGLVLGIAAAVAAAGLVVLTVMNDPGPVFSRGPTASLITVDPRGGSFPIPDAGVRAALSTSPQLGPLGDPRRQASCLTGLGYSPTPPVLGGHQVDVSGRPGVLLLLPGNTDDRIAAVVVEPTCDDAHPGLLARTEVTRR